MRKNTFFKSKGWKKFFKRAFHLLSAMWLVGLIGELDSKLRLDTSFKTMHLVWIGVTGFIALLLVIKSFEPIDEN